MHLQLDAIVTGLIVLMLVIVVLHRVMRWLTSRSLAENGSISRWRFRSTLVAVGLIGVVFCAGLSVVGMKEQSGQLWRAMNDRSKENIPKHDAARSKSASNLKQIGNATANYATGFGALPATTIFNEDGRALHGWHYFLLPYIEQNSLFRQIDPKKPWNHSENAEYFRHGVECYFHVGVPVPNAKDSDGFGITTYATNVHAWSGPHPPKLADFEERRIQHSFGRRGSRQLQALGLSAQRPRSKSRPESLAGWIWRPLEKWHSIPDGGWQCANHYERC